MAKTSQKSAAEEKDPLKLSQNRSSLTYTSCYCEENVWFLCEEIEKRVANAGASVSEDRLSRCFAVFISNPTKSVPIWCQRSSKDPRSVPVVWDYHVIFIFRGRGDAIKDSLGRENPSPACASSSWVYDMDSILTFPESFTVYFDASFGNEEQL